MAQEVTLLREFGQHLYFYCNGQIRKFTADGTDSLIHNIGNTGYVRPGYVKWHDTQFFISEEFPLVAIKGDMMVNIDGANNAAPHYPSALYLVMFRDHLVAGAIANFKGDRNLERVMFSDLRKFGIWEDAQTNEAASYYLSNNNETGEAVEGCTGIGELNQQLLLYTATSVEAVEYVGLPTVYAKRKLKAEIGNCFPYTLIPTSFAHFFISDENIYMVSEDFTISPIGDPIKNFLFENLTPDLTHRYKIHGWLDRTEDYVWWAFSSKDAVAGELDTVIGYNYRMQAWTDYKTADVQSFAQLTIVNAGLTIDELTGTIDGLTPQQINDLSQQTNFKGLRAYGHVNCKIMSEGQFAGEDVENDLVDPKEPEVETPDMMYGAPEVMKEIKSIGLDASYDLATCDGIEIFVSVREKLLDPVVYTSVGLWTTAIYEKRKTFSPRAGRVLRFKFVWRATDPTKGVLDAQFAGWNEEIYLGKAMR